MSSFGTMAEIGAAWITRSEHKIININDFRPERPLNVESTWQNTKYEEENGAISMTRLNADLFCSKIEDVCKKLGYTPNNRKENMEKLVSLITIEK